TYLYESRWDASLADLNAVIRLRPDSVAAVDIRAALYRKQGRFDLAEVEYGKVLAVGTYSWGFYGHGLLRFLEGRDGAAADDFARGRKLETGSRYSSLCLYTARAGEGHADPASLGEEDGAARAADWPMPLIQLYRGKMTEAEVWRAARSEDARIERDQFCEADFYIAEWQLLQGDRKAARLLLERAAAECPVFFVEYEALPVELKRLESKAVLTELLGQ